MEIALMALRQMYDDKNWNDSGWPGLAGQIKANKYDEKKLQPKLLLSRHLIVVKVKGAAAEI